MPQAKGSDDPQSQPAKFIAPMSEDPAKAAAEAAAKAAMEAALQAAAQAGAPTVSQHNNPDNKGTLRINSRGSKRTIRRNTQDPFVWLKSPGTLTWGVASKWLFEDNAAARNQKLKNGEVKRIRCGHFDKDSKIYFWATHHLDPDGIDVHLVKGKYVANIAAWMFEEEIAPAPGISQKFDLIQAQEQMLGLPALCIDRNKARKTKYAADATNKAADETTPKKNVDKKDPGTKDENEKS